MIKAIIRKVFGFLFLGTAVAVQAQFDYVTNADGTSITITGYSKTGPTTVVIPPKINGFSVTGIGEEAFADLSELNGVTIPSSVTSIGYAAFFSTGLENVTIPGNVTNIAESAFQGCDYLTNVTIAFGVPYIVSNMFSGCPSLASATIAGSVTNIGEYAFDGCAELTQVYFTGNAPSVDQTTFQDYRLVGNVDTNFYSATAYYLPGTTGWAEFTSNTFVAADPPSYPVSIYVPAVLWNPVIQASGANFGIQGNHYGFDVTGTTNLPIAVEACDDLSQNNWVVLKRLTLTNGLFHFSEPFQTNNPARFYRIAFP